MIFITGATGLLGSQLVRNLVGRGEQVIALRRSTSSMALLGDAAAKVHWVDGDLNDIDALDTAMKQADRVFHCAALISFSKKDRTALYKTNVEGTANVMNAALTNGVKKVVHVSSVAAFGFHTPEKTITEKSDYSESEGVAHYFRSKHFGEREAWRAQAEGLNVVVANPSTILGGGWWHMEPNSIFLQLKKGLPFYSAGSNGFVDVRDAAKALEILMDEAANGTQYIISAENLSFKTLMEKVAEAMQVTPPPFCLGSVIANAVILFSGIASVVFNKKPLLTAEKYLIASTNFKYSNARFTEAFSFRFRPIEDTIKDTATAFNTSTQQGLRFAVLA
ncbi:MAG: SDR family NAD(P)-dependent oxidoreductase [Chitinophagales bacterium]|nr:SDR family NAD(P)-dependent oxidoreductase [Chitinophagales bacterium]